MATNWKERLRPEIVLFSPSKQEFHAFWRGDSIDVEKKVSFHDHPDQDGSTAQDLGLKSPSVPLTIYFSGPNHDTETARFLRAMSERGAWKVHHPVYGLLKLQPVRVSAKVFSDGTSNITEVSGEYYIPAEDLSSTPSPAAAVDASVKTLEEFTVTDALRMPLTTAAQKRGALQAAKSGLNAVKRFAHNTNERITGIMGTINDLITSTILDVASLSGAVIQLMESPGLFLGNLNARIQQFARLGRQIIADLPAAASFSSSQIAAAMTGELWLNAITAGIGTAITAGPETVGPTESGTIGSTRPRTSAAAGQSVETREEVLAVLSMYASFTRSTRDALDALGAVTAGNPIETQYFPRSASAEAVLALSAAVNRYLLTAMLDLKSERRITLDRPRAPAEIVINELGANSGNFDALFADFCRWNSLHARRILLLNAGEEVILYG